MNRPAALALAERHRYQGDTEALDALLVEALPIAEKVARTNIPKRLPAHVTAGDLLSVAKAAAWECCVSYGPSIEGDFEDYVAGAARNAVVDELRREQAQKRNAGAVVSGPRADRAAAAVADPSPNPHEAAVHAELREKVAGLPDREREVLTRHYFHGDTHEAIAEALGLARETVTRIHARAVARLRGVYEA